MRRSYPQYKSSSGWNALSTRHQRHHPAALAPHYRHVVIGGGFTGVAAARRLAELHPDEEILLLEADIIGEGSSGRNSGFLISTPHNQSMSGQNKRNEAALKQILISKAGQEQLQSLIHQHHIDCQWNPAGKYNAAATPQGANALKKNIEQLRAWNVAVRVLDQDELQETFGTDYYQYGYHTSHNVFVQPASLINGLVQHLPENVTVKENCPVQAITEKTGAVHIELGSGRIHAEKVILANNGFAKSLGFLKSRLVVIYTYAGLTPKLDEQALAAHGKEPEWGIIPANRLGTTLRKYHNQRFMVRSAYSYEKELSPAQVRTELTQLYKNRYPQLGKHDFEYVWGGTTALTRNSAYFFGQLSQRVYGAVGCNGGGVLKGTAYGKLLAELLAGHDSPLLRDALSLTRPSWLPSEPVRSLAIKTAIWYQRKRAGKER